MWLKTYLGIGRERPLWAHVVSDLMAHTVTEEEGARDARRRSNTFLQHWKPKKSVLPKDLKAMMKVAEKYGLRQEGLAYTRAAMRNMPMWDNVHTDEKCMKRLTKRSGATRCLLVNHDAKTVGDFEDLAKGLQSGKHKPTKRCTCNDCEKMIVEKGCSDPHRCWTKAKQILDLLPPKWDPRNRHPEDYEETERRSAIEAAKGEEGVDVFDRRITTKGGVAETFRIFTSGAQPSNESLETSMLETQETETVATDGACENNGFANARAGAGVYVGAGSERNVSIRVPQNMEQTNQVGEAVASLLAT
ncbi:hypothetical protein C2E23DRAFT_685388, partial [Lenzites betulinus]